MSADLEQRVREFVAQHPGLTSTEIARGVHTRLQSVIDVLAGEAFSASEDPRNSGKVAQVYRLVPVAGEKQGRAARRSQCDRVAAMLADGREHTTAEIHEQCGFSRLNSRIAELRRVRGMVIHCHHIEGRASGPDAQVYVFRGFKPGFGPWGGIVFVTSSDAAGAAVPLPAASPDGPVDPIPESGHSLRVHPAGASDSQLEIKDAA